MSIETKQPVTQIRPLLYENNLPAIDRKIRGLNSWRTTVSAGAAVASLVLIVNVGVLVWVRRRFGASDGLSTVFEGSCIESKKDTLWPDLAINIMSTLLLGASNSCAQLLSSPSRQDIDKAHSKGKWLDIGVPSVRNLGHISFWRVCLWALLFLSSIPLHLVYNSVIFSTLSSVDYQAALVTQDFLKGAAWNDTELAKIVDLWGGPGTANMNQLKDIQTSAAAGSLTRLDNSQCIQAYQSSLYESSWKNLLLVTSLSNNDSIIQVWTHQAEAIETSENWLCHGDVGPNGNAATTCNFNDLVSHASSWKIAGVCRDNTYSSACVSPFDAPILYCLAEPFPGNCKIQVSTTLLTIVILFNAVKVACLLTTAFSRKFEPLGTVGDAISSFLEQPDDRTANLGPVCKSLVQKHSWKKAYISGSQNMSFPFKRKPRRWARAVSGSRWFICMALCLVVWCAGFFLYLTAKNGSKRSSSSFTQGFDTSPANTISFTLGNSLISNVLLANTPQIVISFVYLFYNNVFTCMVMAHEYARFASARKPLRVTRPYGEQRSTFWLQLPYRYIVPIMVIMAFMHWSVSRSIYLVQLEIYDNNGELMEGRSVTGCGYSPPPIVLSLCLGGAMILLLLGLSARRLDPGMPIAGSCSLAISAAAHAGKNEVDAAAQHIQYGVITEDGIDERGRRRIGFSSRPVEKLVAGETYA
ncbi:hypothetical protein CGMCC3_g1083 [Colletotrichum fructicola]|uniref:DUF6536 domain-containing protein n=1 Tax=Colletotrichum fructicola (strain Nara gc5) TaxID=1213859 RepID=L2G9D5_COLFN|nr:uncharacterized protein CGMCC3_g1083 [Colletotrichum fructicola]KAF4481401.1 hypothetical protein CGGC5_v010895 [Colletotrichum fructicola Nara gc5]KAE9582748.1 hypothetical protein CGMCC3_g1083 [Colletotrichum fructicola]KAF4412602.1 hypothetical protein CFRS1_v002583 [Colletotrichum fructicola]KAF4902093.1 hypothetical protein CGCFRS4_v002423 [Colletotrichum fructicola]KAF4934624.1 hypothetical protein CGCF245_v008479 [Colletotrichum fructicola]